MRVIINPLKAELNPICHLLALVGTHHILHFSRVKVKAVGNTVFKFAFNWQTFCPAASSIKY